MSTRQDEEVIRKIVNQAISRINQGDIAVFDDLWDENADYVGVDGTLLKGRVRIQAFFRELLKRSALQQTAVIDQIRFVSPEFATVDGSWTVTGARDNKNKELPPINGRGFELVQKKRGRWRFIATREMVPVANPK